MPSKGKIILGRALHYSNFLFKKATMGQSEVFRQAAASAVSRYQLVAQHQLIVHKYIAVKQKFDAISLKGSSASLVLFLERR